jgi:hypothetical protein
MYVCMYVVCTGTKKQRVYGQVYMVQIMSLFCPHVASRSYDYEHVRQVAVECRSSLDLRR